MFSLSLLLVVDIHFLFILSPKRLAFKRKTKFIYVVLHFHTFVAFSSFAEQLLWLQLWQRFPQRLFQWIQLGRHVLLLVGLEVLFDWLLQDVADAKEGFRDAIKVNFPHFNLENLNIADFPWNLLVIFLILFNYWPVNFICCLVDSLNVFFDVFDDSPDLFFQFWNCVIDQSYWLFDFDSLVQYVIVAFVFLQFQGFVQQFKVFVDFFDLFSIKFLWFDQVFLDLLFLLFNLIQKTFWVVQEILDF